MDAEQLEPSEGDFEESHEPVKFAIVGRPNVGKSTLTNRMLGEDRVIVYDYPGTTRDSIYIPMERDEKQYVIIDTAGVRKRKKVTETVEKFSTEYNTVVEECKHTKGSKYKAIKTKVDLSKYDI